MKHVFLIAGVAVLAFAIFKHHKAVGSSTVDHAPLLGTEAPRMPVGGPADPISAVAPANDGKKQIAVAPGSFSSFFHPLEL